MAKALGVGGVFFKCEDPKKLAAWYAEHLGFEVADHGSVNFWFKNAPKAGCTVWGPFAADTDYFNPSKKKFMINLIVDDLEGALAQVAAGGAQVVGEIEDYDYGRFGWFIDPEGNKIELWQVP